MKAYGPAGALLAIFFGLWEAGTLGLHVAAWILPSPGLILRTLWADRALLAANAGTTLAETVIGFLLALGCAAALAVAIRFSRTLARALWPLLVASQTVPVPAIAPALVIWLGYGLAPKVVVVGLICFFPIVVGAVDGFRAVDPDLLRALRTLGAGRRRLFWEVEVPAALPSFFSGAKVAITFSVIGAVLGEWVGSSRGLGYVMIQSTAQLQTARVFAAIAILSVMGVGLFLVVSALERACLPWKRVAGRNPGV